jgi:hypothetical protein
VAQFIVAFLIVDIRIPHIITCTVLWGLVYFYNIIQCNALRLTVLATRFRSDDNKRKGKKGRKIKIERER